MEKRLVARYNTDRATKRKRTIGQTGRANFFGVGMEVRGRREMLVVIIERCGTIGSEEQRGEQGGRVWFTRDSRDKRKRLEGRMNQ